MDHLPPPPRFTLPPPPMLPLDVLDANLLSKLTCSSIRQRHQFFSNPRLILLSSIMFLLVVILLTILVLIIQFYRQRKLSTDTNRTTTNVITSKNMSLSSGRSYETISSHHTGLYLESIDTSATTYSTDPSHIVCVHCQHERDSPRLSLPPYYHTLDILPS